MIYDSCDHAVDYGDKYVVGRYLDLFESKKKYHEYKLTKQSVFINSASIFMPQVPVESMNDKTVKISSEFIVERNMRSRLL